MTIVSVAGSFYLRKLSDMKYLSINQRVYRRAILLFIVTVTISVIYLLIINIKSPITQQYDEKIKFHANCNPQPYIVPRLDKRDYNRLINLTNFEFTITNTCSDDNVLLAVVVTSAPKNLESRNIIRTTWGKNDKQVKTYFMLGAVEDDATQEAIDEEHAEYHDIVQGNFIDSYKNLTYKTIMALKFITYHCTNATYILKTDDDIFVNMPLFKNFLINDLSPCGAVNCLMCHKMENKSVIRRWSKWAVREDEFPAEEYPTYCGGPYSLFSPDVVFKLYKEAQRQKFFWIEDVFLYGIVAGKFPEIELTDLKKYSLWENWLNYMIVRTRRNFLFGFFEMSTSQLKEFWKFVNGRPVKHSIYDSN